MRGGYSPAEQHLPNAAPAGGIEIVGPLPSDHSKRLNPSKF